MLQGEAIALGFGNKTPETPTMKIGSELEGSRGDLALFTAGVEVCQRPALVEFDTFRCGRLLETDSAVKHAPEMFDFC